MIHKKTHKPFRGALISLLAGVLALPLAAFGMDLDKTVNFDIPAQDLSSALIQFSKQTRLQVVISDDVAGKSTPGITGQHAIKQALSQLLQPAGLRYRVAGESTISVAKFDGTAAVSAAETQTSGAGHAVSLRLAQNTQTDTTSGQSSEDSQSESKTGEAGQNPSPPKGGDKEGVLQEIVVTAQKREERLIDTPQSVSVLSADALNKLNATQFRDFANTVPGLTFTTEGAGLTQISLRGVTSGVDLSQTVGVYVDEVPYGSSNAFSFVGARSALDVGVFDLVRIEVLRGPQGTLYGASTMGGLIKYVTKQPDAARFGGEVQTGFSGTHDGGISYNASATVNAPIVADRVALRVSGFYSHDGGYIDNVTLGKDDVNRSNVYGGRADLLFTPTSALKVRLTGLLQNISRDGTATAAYALSTSEPLGGSLEQRRRFAEPFDQQFRLVSGTIDYDLGGASLTSVSSYQTAEAQTGIDSSTPFLLGLGPYSAVGLVRQGGLHKFTQEVRLASQQTKTLEWVIGGFYTRESSENVSNYAPVDLAGQPAPNVLFTGSVPSRYKEYAAFGDLTYYFSEKLDVSAGLRRARNEQDFVQIASGRFGLSAPASDSSENVTTYLANTRYHLDKHTTAYLRFATGYRPGGPNFIIRDATGVLVGPPTFESDRLKSYEVGLKSETADRRFGVDLATYYIDWSNIQINVVRGGFGAVANAPGGATVRGAELTLAATPIRRFSMNAALAYQNAELSEANADLGGRKGERLPNVPRFTAALNADYQLPFENLQPTIGATLRRVGDRMASYDKNTSRGKYSLPAYTTLDLRLGALFGSVNVDLYIHNVFDERGQLSAVNSGAVASGIASPAILQPRTVGVSARLGL